MDRENVIKALEYCKDNQHVNDCNICDYGGKTGMFCIRMIDDILDLLKEQEKRINDLEEKLRIDISLEERNDNFYLYDTPIFGFHD